jgi:serine/threonine protein kinase
MPPDLPTDAKNLIRRMLEVDPKRRITVGLVLRLPLILYN